MSNLRKNKRVTRPIIGAPCLPDVSENTGEKNSMPSTKNTLKDHSSSMNMKSPLLTPCRSIGLKRKSAKLSSVNPTIVSSAARISSHVGLRRTTGPLQLSYTGIKNDESNTTGLKSVKKLKVYAGTTKRKYTQSYLKELKARVAEKRKKLSSYHVLEPQKSGDCSLSAEILMWRGACQEALEDLLQHIHAKQGNDQGKIDMSKLLQHLDIPATLVNYDSENQQFI